MVSGGGRECEWGAPSSGIAPHTIVFYSPVDVDLLVGAFKGPCQESLQSLEDGLYGFKHALFLYEVEVFLHQFGQAFHAMEVFTPD